LAELKISRVYEGSDSVKGYEYPFTDTAGRKYRLEDIKITDEEYYRLLELSKASRTTTTGDKEPSISGWHTFGIIFIVLTVLSGTIMMFNGGELLVLGIATIISGLLTGAPMILLSNIQYELKKLNHKK
jgi:hypothetical protein